MRIFNFQFTFNWLILRKNENITSNLIFDEDFKNKIFSFPAGQEPEIGTGSILAPCSAGPKVVSNEREWKIMVFSDKIGARLGAANNASFFRSFAHKPETKLPILKLTLNSIALDEIHPY